MRRLLAKPWQEPPILAFAGLSILLLVIWVIYLNALPGHFLFDDPASLDGLRKVHDLRSSLAFTFSGNTGPLGRPLALATFALQSAAWPNDPAAMLRANIAIHLAAVVLCFFLAAGLIRLRPPNSGNNVVWIALGAAALWGLSPFLATTHLMIIQRMTSLAGVFTLGGLAALTWAHLVAERHGGLSKVLLIAVGLSTVVATLAKENGALLPSLALVIQRLWIPKERRINTITGRYLIALFVYVPSALVVLYLASLLPGILENGYGPRRYFTPSERLLSQLAILLDYVRNLFFPQAFATTPFMDRIPAAKGWLNPPITLLSTVFWVAVITISVYYRRLIPVLLFGLTFFLVGHILESSFIGLELYFAHRSYVPAFGLYFALAYFVALTPVRFSRAIAFGFVGYVFMFGVVLYQVTSAWSETHISAVRWVERNPYSERATQVLANQHIQRNDFTGARNAFDALARFSPDLPLIQIQRTQFCEGQEDGFPELLDNVTQQLRTASFQQYAAVELFKAALGEPSRRCAPRSHEALARMARALLENPPYARSSLTAPYLFGTKAITLANEGQAPEAIELFLKIFRDYEDINAVTYGAILMANSGRYARAYSFLDQARAAAPNNPFKAIAWHRHIDEVWQVVERAEAIKSSEPLPDS